MSERTERTDFQATSDPALLASADRGEAHLLDLPAALRAVGAPAVGDAGHRLHAGPHRLARADRRGRALPAHVRPVVVLHRRAARGRRARADDARRARRGDAHLPLHADRRRGAPRRVLRPLLQRGRGARVRQPRGAARGDLRAPQPGVRRAVRRDAQLARRPPGRRAGGPRDAGRGHDALPHGHRGHARPHRPALHHGLQRAPGHAARLRRRASRMVARDEHRHVAFGARFLRDMARTDPRYVDGDPAHAGRGRARSPTACSGRTGWRAATTR